MSSPFVFAGSDAKALFNYAGGILLNSGQRITRNPFDENYILNPTFDIDPATPATGWWQLQTVTMSGTTPTGAPTYTAPGYTMTRAAMSNPSRYALNVTMTGNWAAGIGFSSNQFTVKRKHYGKVMRIRFAAEIIAGFAAINNTGTTASTFTVWVHHQYASTHTWIPVSGGANLAFNSKVGSTTASGMTAFDNLSFQTIGDDTTGGGTYEVVVLCTTAATGNTGNSLTIQLEDAYCGPVASQPATLITDWTSYTPSFGGFGTCTNINFIYRRVGGNLEVRGYFQTGTPTAAAATISLPAGLTTSALLPGNGTQRSPVGELARATAATTSGQGGPYTVLAIASDTLFYCGSGGSTTYATNNARNGSELSGASEIYTLWAEVPIQGWGTNTSAAAEAGDARVISGTFTNNTSFTPTSSMVYPTTGYSVVHDTMGGFSTTTGMYTIQVPGYYMVTAFGQRGTAGSNYILFSLVWNGIQEFISAGNSNLDRMAGASLVRWMPAGATVKLGAYSNGSTDAVISHSWSILRLQGSGTILPGESLEVQASTAAGQTINTTTSVVVFGTVARSTHGTGAYNPSTGVFTAPTPGTYAIKGSLLTVSQTYTATQYIQLEVWKNGATHKRICNVWGNGSAVNMSATGGTEVYLLAGETMSLAAYSSVATTLVADGTLNHMVIHKVSR